MDEKDLPSSSDESDTDFVPKEEDYKSESGSEESDYESSEGEKDKTDKSRKRKKKGRKSNKKPKVEEKEKAKKDHDVEEEKKVDVDALWADFKKDVSSSTTKKTAESSSKHDIEAKVSDSCVSQSNSETKADVKKPVRGFPSRNRGGLSNVLNQIGKKDKMSTLQKSQLDWNNFKKSEGIEEEIKLYNKGKDGYLDKQDFLQRTDLRQFEIEKDLRNTSRRKF